MKRVAGFFFYVIWMIVIWVISLSWSLVVAIIRPFVPESKVYKLRVWMSVWSRMALKLAFSPVEVRGMEHMIEGPAIALSNHQSTMDIMVISGYMPLDFLFFSKKELFYIPLTGQTMRALQYIPVDRKSPKRAARSIRKGISEVKKGKSILVFPEGSRNVNPREVQPLKAGSLVIARHSKAPVVPVVIYGTNKILPINKKLYMLPHPVIVEFLKPIFPGDKLHPANAKTREEEDELLIQLRSLLGDAYNKIADEVEKSSPRNPA